MTHDHHELYPTPELSPPFDISSAPLRDIHPLPAMSTPDGVGSRLTVSTDSSSIKLSVNVADPEDCQLRNEIQRRARQACEEYESRGDLDALELWIQSCRLALDMTEDGSPEESFIRYNLAASLHARYEAIGELRDLEEVISLGGSANAVTPDEHPVKATLLTNLADWLFSRFEREGSFEDLQEAISLKMHAIKLVPDHRADKPSLLSSLGRLLQRRFKHTENSDDLDEAISLRSRASDLTPDGDPGKLIRSMGLAASLRSRFEQSGNLEDINRAIALQGRWLDLIPHDHPQKRDAFNHAVVSLWARFQRLGNVEDIERAILLQSRLIDLTPDGHPDMSARLSEAGSLLHARFDRLRNMEDLSQAIHFTSRAVEHSQDSYPDKQVWLNNLATTLQDRYEKTGDLKDFRQAIVYYARAIELTPNGDPDKPLYLSNFGCALREQARRSGSLEILDAAITHQTKAVTLAPEGHPDKHLWLYHLSLALRQRFDQVGHATDLEQAIRCSMRSVELIPENHADRALWLRLLGLLFQSRLRSPHAHADDATHAMKAFFEALQHQNSRPFERLLAARLYAVLLTEFPRLLPPSLPLSLLEAYKHAIDLIPQCIWLGNDVHSWYTSDQVKIAGRLTNEAVAAAITAGEYVLALEWLEAGRAVVTSQVLQLRTPLDNLQRLHPQLADELAQVSRALQRATVGSSNSLSTSPLPTLPPSETRHHTDPSAQSSHGHVLRYNDLIAQVRMLEGFEDFLRPKMLLQLTGACVSGPVVLINIHSSRCDALILHTPGIVKHVPLPLFSYDRAMNLQRTLTTRCPRGRFRDGLQDEDIEEDRGGHVDGRDGEYNPMYDVLEDLWTRLVKPILEVVCSLPIAAGTTAGSLPHITWCPTGRLTFLPIHAAGIYRGGNRRKCVMDYAVSSYTPTLQALLKPRVQAISTPASREPRVMIVSQPATPNCDPIPGTALEAAIVMSLAGRSDESIVLDDEAGTVDAVLEGMQKHEWVHLACHGIQNRENSLNSAFMLYDGRLTINTLMSKSFPNAELAVLSACQTATGDEQLSDEAVHLAAWMLNIGYKSVIGTMWSISDSSAPILMEEFYRVLMAQVHAREAIQPAYALHEAVKLLRGKCNNELNRWNWVPFVHFGR